MTGKQTGIRIFFGVLKALLVVALVFLLSSWGKKAYEFGYCVFAQEAVSRPPGREVAVTVDDGMSGRELSLILKEKGLVRDADVFYVQLLLSEEKDKLQKGSYLLNTSQGPEEMLKILSGQVETEG